MKLWCCGCKHDVEVRLVFGVEVYPHRDDLARLPFWKCDTCRNHVGCHHKTSTPTKPLGCIPDAEMKNARKHIHRILDPIYKTGKMRRQEIYKQISRFIGYEYHTAELRTIEDARQVYKFLLEYRKAVNV